MHRQAPAKHKITGSVGKLWRHPCPRIWFWDGYEAIVEACCDAWNKLMQMTERIASLTKRPWAKAVTG
jgi:hypothetical protein